ncbi:MAG: hypothetical protein NC428_10530 [Clostridium sp.]|nr:hypothetical protein [Clostridium sp.]
MQIDINLNIHYSAPAEVWHKIDEIYQSMPYWNENANFPEWKGDDIQLSASLEPSGIQIYGTMPDDIWQGWYAELKQKLTKALGYEIGEPENGYKFHYYD